MSDLVEPVADVAPEPDASPADDLRAAIAAAWDEHAGEAEPEASEPAAAERDERGRFASRDTETSEAEAQHAEEVTQEAAVPTPAEPPASPIAEVLEKYRDLYATRGLQPAAAVGNLFEAQRLLETRPVDAIRVLARDYGVDLAQFAPPPAQNDPTRTGQTVQTNDPAVNAALQEVRAIRAEIEAQKQQTVEAENARVHQSIATFAADPKHSHFPAVRTAMGALMQAGIANDLPTAYEMACRAHPEVHKAIQAAEAEKHAKSDREAKRKAAADAKGIAVSVRGTAPPPGFRQAPDSIRETLLAAWDGRLN